MALVHHQQPIGREVVQQGPGASAGWTPGQGPAVILNAGAEADLAHHLQVIAGALFQALRFQQFALGLKLLELRF